MRPEHPELREGGSAIRACFIKETTSPETESSPRMAPTVRGRARIPARAGCFWNYSLTLALCGLCRLTASCLFVLNTMVHSFQKTLERAPHYVVL